MATETLVWTALPNGLDDNGNLRLSALIAPRLVPDADEILKPFTAFLDWPAAVRARQVHHPLRRPGGRPSRATSVAAPARVDGTVDLPDSADLGRRC